MGNTAQYEIKNILERMREQGLWQPSGLGLSYVKEGDKTVKLISQENTSKSADARARMKILVERAGWKVDESICEIIEVTHLSPEEKQMREIILFTKDVKLQKRVSFMRKIIGKSQLNMMAIFKNLDQCMNVKLNFILNKQNLLVMTK